MEDEYKKKLPSSSSTSSGNLLVIERENFEKEKKRFRI